MAKVGKNRKTIGKGVKWHEYGVQVGNNKKGNKKERQDENLI